MKTSEIILSAVGIFLAAESLNAAVVVANWTFENNSGSPPYAAATTDSAVTSAQLGVTSVGTISISTGNPGNGLLITGLGQNVNGSVLTFTLQTSGATFNFSTLTFDYNRTDSSKSPTTISWTYQINGTGPQSSLGSSTLSSTGWRTDGALSTSAVTLGVGDSVTFQGTLSGGANGSSGTIGFDDFVFNASSITPVPEPIRIAILLFGCTFAGVRARRLLFRRVK